APGCTGPWSVSTTNAESIGVLQTTQILSDMIVSSVKLTYLFSALHNSSTSFHLINNFSYSVCRDNHLVKNLTNIFHLTFLKVSHTSIYPHIVRIECIIDVSRKFTFNIDNIFTTRVVSADTNICTIQFPFLHHILNFFFELFVLVKRI